MKRSLAPAGALTLVFSIALAGCGSSDAQPPATSAGGQSGAGGAPLTGGAAGTTSTGGAAGTIAGGSGGAAGGVAGGGSGGASAGSAGAGGSSGGSSGAAGSGGSTADASTDAKLPDAIAPTDATVSDATVPLGIAPDGIVAIMRKVADWGYANNTSYGKPMSSARDWSAGTFYTGLTATWQVTKDDAYKQKIIAWGNTNQWLPNSVGYGDDLACIQTYFESYIFDPQPGNESRYLPSKNLLDAQLAKNPTGRSWFAWIDLQYMGPPNIAMLGAITGQTSYYDKITTMWFDCAAARYDATSHLWFWTEQYIYPTKTTPKGNPMYWGPGNAWVYGGLTRVLKYLPATHPDRPRWVKQFQDMSDALRAKQQPDGMWRTGLYEPTEYPDPESSSTSFFTYGMGLGMLWGLLDQPTYMPVVQKAWPALVAAVDANGKVGRCQPWAHEPAAVPATANTPEGQGALQLAGQAMWLLATR